MAIMATESGTSSKKPGSASHVRGEPELPSSSPSGKTRPNTPPSARSGEADKPASDKAPKKVPETENVDDDLEDPYDNVACTD